MSMASSPTPCPKSEAVRCSSLRQRPVGFESLGHIRRVLGMSVLCRSKKPGGGLIAPALAVALCSLGFEA